MIYMYLIEDLAVLQVLSGLLVLLKQAIYNMVMI